MKRNDFLKTIAALFVAPKLVNIEPNVYDGKKNKWTKFDEVGQREKYIVGVDPISVDHVMNIYHNTGNIIHLAT